MSITVGTDTYISAEDANSYFAQRLHSSAWTNANDNDRENALRTATSLLNTLDYHGRRTVETQTLAWPRAFVRNRDRCIIACEVVPQDVITATCEWAIYLLTNDPSKPQSVVTHRQVGDLQLDFSPTLPDTLPPLVRKFLEPYLLTSQNTASIIV